MILDKPQKLENEEPRSRKPTSPLIKISLWVAAILHILVFILFRLNSNYLPDYEHFKPYVTFVSSDSLAKDAELEEYTMLFDSAPLFIPTVWSAAQSVKVDFESVSLEQLPEFEPRIELLDKLEPKGLLKRDNFRVDKPSDLLASRFWRFFDSFGRSAETPMPFEPTAAVAEVSVISSSQNQTLSLTVDLEPVALLSLPQPVSYTLRRLSGGLIRGVPSLVETSGNDAFDQSVARWLQRPDVLAQLPDGYLFIRVFFW